MLLFSAHLLQLVQVFHWCFKPISVQSDPVSRGVDGQIRVPRVIANLEPNDRVGYIVLAQLPVTKTLSLDSVGKKFVLLLAVWMSCRFLLVLLQLSTNPGWARRRDIKKKSSSIVLGGYFQEESYSAKVLLPQA